MLVKRYYSYMILVLLLVQYDAEINTNSIVIDENGRAKLITVSLSLDIYGYMVYHFESKHPL